jgi:hypothetical protein
VPWPRPSPRSRDDPPAARPGCRVSTHDLKTWPEHYREVAAGRKTFEIRKDDRGGFRVGDVLVLREYQPVSRRYTGRSCRRVVTHVLPGGQFGLAEGFVCMSLAAGVIAAPPAPTPTDHEEQTA